MTVKELIEVLKQLPQDLEVLDFSYDKVEGVCVKKIYKRPSDVEEVEVAIVE